MNKHSVYRISMLNYETNTKTHYDYDTLEELADGLRCLALVPHLVKVLWVDLIEW